LNCGSEHPAVGPRDFAEINVRAAAFDAVANQSDLVSNFHGSFAPALPGQRIRAIRFRNPFFGFSIFTSNVKVDEGVRIDPIELRYDPLYGRGVRHVVIGPAVVREHWPAKEEKSYGPEEHRQQLIFHLSILWNFRAILVQNLMPAARSCQSQVGRASACLLFTIASSKADRLKPVLLAHPNTTPFRSI
jgi:hypothetical protein